jgi:hypothetical protein
MSDYEALSAHAFDCNLGLYLMGRLPASLWDETLDDGDGGYGKIPYLPARHDRPAMSEAGAYTPPLFSLT